ncbi:hypothetical protein [Candidatus Minimicrobia naudis]
MNKATYDELALERIAKEKFGFPIDVQSIILWHADVSRTAKASVFLTNKKQLMMYLEATSPLILSDVKKDNFANGYACRIISSAKRSAAIF